MRQIINIDVLRKADVLDDPDYVTECEQLEDFFILVVVTAQVDKDGTVSEDENISRPRPFSILLPLPLELVLFSQAMGSLCGHVQKDGVHEPKIVTQVSGAVRNAINDGKIITFPRS